ncbi:GspE/PulE family protein [Neptuniibacter caesariensis]|uniref:Bacterial type II secretion system protein E:GAF domain n=1 Tax=Neptuniibacter caesariensis TaxID=207954 RepID=A0A7U8C6A4_NEPCE|nr:GspE/PulE family protein [Neptuniibacter caesariensis]EAR62373.1 Bacterial type II secretion system protein E:GAF domain [Oceanospirillum sp. MED92] [Neptuniibacter caesariensis]
MTKAIEKDTQQFYSRLTKVLSKIHQAKSFEEAYPLVEKTLLALFNAQRITVYQRNRSSKDIVSRFKTGKDLTEIRVPITASSIAGFVALSKKALVVKDVRNTEELQKINPALQFNDSFEKDIEFKSRSMLVLPILYQDVLLGVIQIINRRDGKYFSAIDLKRGRQFAELLGQKFRYDFGCTEGPYDYLLEQKLIDEKAFKQLQEKADERNPITRLLRDHARLTSAQIGQSLECFYQVPFVAYNPERYYLHPLCDQVNKAYLKNSNIALLAEQGSEHAIILIDDPNDTKRLMEIKNVVGSHDSQICIGLIDDIHQYLGFTASQAQQDGANLSTILDELDDGNQLDIEEAASETEEVSEEDSTVVRLVNRVLLDAKRLRASDIHIEPGKGRTPTSVRMRIDGVCQEIIQIPATHAKATVSRIKIMSRLDIAEKRLPQDGKFAVRLQGQALEVRVATIPTVNGEGVVMRLLQSGEPVAFDQLNFSATNQTGVKELLQHPHGILLVVGPTGSGKTTTLHALLATLNTPERKIWTAEDPVEITQPGLQQVQIQPKTGFTFAAALRSFLRADPDIILIGEMRDQETAHAAVEASLTGHLVLSTLHTNSAPETITRLLDLGIDPVSFSDALLGVLAQRLVRTLCPSCRKPYKASTEEIAFLKRRYGALYKELKLGEKVKLYKAEGCVECNQTGYRGRTGIHELLVSTPQMREKIYQGATVSEIREQAESDGMRSLLQDGILKVLKGDIDFEQLRRVTAE